MKLKTTQQISTSMIKKDSEIVLNYQCISKMKYSDYFGPMLEGHIYHVYNQGIDGKKIFRDEKDRIRFKQGIIARLTPFVDLISYAIMDNHFHLVFRVKKYEHMLAKIEYFSWLVNFIQRFAIISQTRFKGWPIASALISEVLRCFTMSYVKYYNKRHRRSGSLFRKGFRHKSVTDISYLRALVAYVHRNPMHHHYKRHYKKYKWTSYSSNYETYPPAGINLEELRIVYGSVESYNYYHDHISVPDYVMETVC